MQRMPAIIFRECKTDYETRGREAHYAAMAGWLAGSSRRRLTGCFRRHGRGWLIPPQGPTGTQRNATRRMQRAQRKARQVISRQAQSHNDIE